MPDTHSSDNNAIHMHVMFKRVANRYASPLLARACLSVINHIGFFNESRMIDTQRWYIDNNINEALLYYRICIDEETK